jgi:predicted O-methyltransferase YrrM
MHEAIITDSARYFWGKNANLNRWKKALQEIEYGLPIAPRQHPENKVVGNTYNTTFGKWIYACVRVLQPEVMIETGVAHGASSCLILNAMHLNGKGKLISVDLPDNDTNPDYNFSGKKVETGWMVPDALRSRWQLRLGYAQELLPAILNEEKEIDIFFHDSDHSYAHMKYEFEISATHIRKGGLLLSDDVHKNSAFSEFTERAGLKALQFNKGGAALFV